MLEKQKIGRDVVGVSLAVNRVPTKMTPLASHEKECAIRYENIERRLEAGSKRFDKLERMLWAIYPFIVGTVLLAKYVG